jgi:hypothetical protein
MLRRVKLGRCLDTLPERLALAKSTGLGHGEFLEPRGAGSVGETNATAAKAMGTRRHQRRGDRLSSPSAQRCETLLADVIMLSPFLDNRSKPESAKEARPAWQRLQ